MNQTAKHSQLLHFLASRHSSLFKLAASAEVTVRLGTRCFSGVSWTDKAPEILQANKL